MTIQVRPNKSNYKSDRKTYIFRKQIICIHKISEIWSEKLWNNSIRRCWIILWFLQKAIAMFEAHQKNKLVSHGLLARILIRLLKYEWIVLQHLNMYFYNSIANNLWWSNLSLVLVECILVVKAYKSFIYIQVQGQFKLYALDFIKVYLFY